MKLHRSPERQYKNVFENFIREEDEEKKDPEKDSEEKVSKDEEGKKKEDPPKKDSSSSGSGKATITFDKASKAAIWDFVLLKELSNGRWEDADPDGHDKFWKNAKVELGGEDAIELSKEPPRQRYRFIDLLFEGNSKNAVIVFGMLGEAIGTNYREVIKKLAPDPHEIAELPPKPRNDEDAKKVQSILDDEEVASAYVDAFDDGDYNEEIAKEDLQAIEDLLKGAEKEEDGEGG